MDTLPGSVLTPAAIPGVHRAPGRKVLGQQTPLTTRAYQIKDAIEHFAAVCRRTSHVLAFGQKRLQQCELLIRKIRVITLYVHPFMITESDFSHRLLDLLDKLCKHHPDAGCLHLILDNYKIHKSDLVNAALRGYLSGKVQLHFLPQYCQDDNKIERLWQELHAYVTCNHCCADMKTLMAEVRYYLRKRNKKTLHTGLLA